MLSDLKALRDIISTSVDVIITECERTGVNFPSLDEPFQPSSGGIRQRADVSEAIRKIVAASQQLLVSVQMPQLNLANFNHGYLLATCLGVMEAGNVAELLREAGPKGMHVKDIAEKTGIPSRKLGIIMLFLATKHVFREVTPGMFANNAISSLLDSGKAFSSELNAETKLDSSQGMHTEVAFYANWGQKGAPYLIDVMKDPQWRQSEMANHTATQKAFNTDLNFFDFLDLPQHDLDRKQFAKCMAGSVLTQPTSFVFTAFDWDSLKPGSLVVDIGGSLGYVSMSIAREYPQLKFAVEDRPSTSQDAIQYWKQRFPAAIEQNQVEFIGHDFLQPQPKLSKDPDVFLLRFIVHDWSDKYAIQMLKHLRNAAKTDTKLVVIDAIVSHACKPDNPKITAPPKPLLQNWGEANVLIHNISASILTFFNAGERTQEGFEEIFAASGWKLQEIRWQSDLNVRPSLIAVTAPF